MTDTPDTRIAQALSSQMSEDDQAFLDSLESERGLFTQIGDTWKGPMGGWAKLVFGFTAALGVLFLFVIWKTANTTDNVAVHTLWAIMGVALLVVMITSALASVWRSCSHRPRAIGARATSWIRSTSGTRWLTAANKCAT